MAAGHTPGAAALVLAATPPLTVDQLKAALLSYVDLLPALAGKMLKGGRLHVCKRIPRCVSP